MAFLLATKLAAAAAATSLDFTAPLTTATSGALELRADATATSSSVVALTTTFTPPASCADDHLTMLTAKSYQIWINEPAPLPGSLLSDCYPSEWVDNYSSAVSSSSSMVPVMSPLVCPSGWKTQTANSWSSGYMACCASGFTLAPPSSTVDKDRPAYGGTCYSAFDLSQTATVTVYNESALSTTTEWTASTTPAQAYAHPIDGYALDYTPTASESEGASSTAEGTAGYTGAASSSGTSSDASSIGSDELKLGMTVALLVTVISSLL